MIDVVAVLEVTLVKVFTEHRSMVGNDIHLNHSIIIKLGELLVQLAANISNFFISILRMEPSPRPLLMYEVAAITQQTIMISF